MIVSKESFLDFVAGILDVSVDGIVVSTVALTVALMVLSSSDAFW